MSQPILQLSVDWLSDNRPQKDGKTFVFSICGIEVCVTFLLKTLGITRRKFYRLKKEFLVNDRRSGIHGSSGTTKLCWKSEAALNFMETYFSLMCDSLPTGNLLHLPSNIRRTDIYGEMKATLLIQGQQCCSEATFNNLWKEHFPNVKIPKVIKL